MKKQIWDPLQVLPSPETVRQELLEAERVTERLRILLEASERLHAHRENNHPATTRDRKPEPVS
jgi:hypothetical protein